MRLLGVNQKSVWLTLPTDVFVDAVRLASVPRSPVEQGRDEGLRCAAVQRNYAAVDHLTAWWNEKAPTDLRGAFSFTYYVKVKTAPETFWASGDREEGYVSETTMARYWSGRGEALVLDSIILVFYREPTVYGRAGFSAVKVDGSHGVEGGLPEWLSAEELIATDAYDSLHEFPSRFADLWAKLQNN